MKRLYPLFAALLLAGCATNGPITKTLTLKDNGQACTVPVGTTLMVSLAANPTTGYDWKPVAANHPVLKLVRSTYAQSGAPTILVGAGGNDTFQLAAVKPGQQVLELNYVRPWEKDVPPARTVRFPITVTP
jgi:inhibitor of cysteine peptidase